jgi:hypothetical protein
VSQADLNRPPLEKEIRRRAYEIWLQRGGQDGLDVVDWLIAEEEIRNAQKEIPKMAQQEQQLQCRQCGKQLNSEEELREHIQSEYKGQQQGEKVRGAGGGTGEQQSGQ